MRILVLINSLYTGGAEFSTLDFYQWLVKRGYLVQVVCLKKATPSYDPLDFGFDNIVYLKSNGFWRQSSELMSIIENFKPNLIHSVLFDANIVARICRFKLNGFVHLESLVNETYSKHRLSEPGINAFKLWGYRILDYFTTKMGTDFYHANSQTVAKHYIQKLGLSPKRIKVVFRGRKPNPFLEIDKGIARNTIFPILHGKLVIAHVGRHEYQKGHDVLLDALHKIDGDLRKDLKVLLIGREGKMTQMIIEKIVEYNLQDVVLVLGHRGDVEQLLALSDIFVFPSRFEGLPGALIEAEAAGLPIICTDIPNNLEVVRAGENANVHRVDDAKALADHLQHLILDEDEATKMGKLSLALFSSNFTRKQVHHQMLQMIDQLLDKK